MAQEMKEMPNNPMEHDKYMPETFNVLGKRGVCQDIAYPSLMVNYAIRSFACSGFTKKFMMH